MRKHWVLYDGDCPFCCRVARALRWMDWLKRLECVPAPSALAIAQARGVTPSQLHSALHCLAADGRVLAGAEALRFIGLRLPLLCVPSLLLWLPGALPLAQRAYRWFAARRPRNSACGPDSCPRQAP